MKRLSLHGVAAWLLLIILGFIVLHAPITVYISSQWPHIADVAKAWKELLMVLATVVIAVLCTRQRAWGWIVRDKLLLLMAGYIVLHFAVVLVLHMPLKATVAGLMIDLRYVAYFMLVYILVRMYPVYKASFVKVGLCGAIIVVGFAVMQLALPNDFLARFGYGDSTIQPYMTIDKNPDFIRHNSTLRGPNPLGAYAVIVLTAVLAYGLYKWGKLRSKWAQVALVALGAASIVALVISYSRSAWLGMAVAALLVVVVCCRKWLTPKRIGLLGAGAVIVMGVGLFAARDTYFMHNVILHDNPTTGAETTSNDGHAASLKDGFEESVSKPLGAGVGSTGSASLYTNNPLIVENQFLFTAHEVGWPGVAMFTGILLIVLLRLWRKRKNWLPLGLFASGIGLLVIGMLLPVWVDDTVSIVWWGLAAAVLAVTAKGNDDGRPATNKKAKRTA